MAKAALHHRVETPDPVAFITIDDGFFTDPLATAHVLGPPALPVTQFLTYYAANQGTMDPPPGSPGALNIAELRKYQTGTATQQRIGCHHKQHLDYRGQTLAEQTTALNDAADWLGHANMFTYRPTLFRPPYGQYDVATLTAAYAAGLPHLVLWTHEWDGSAFVGTWGTPRLRPGDILLCHHPSQSGMDGYLLAQLQAAQAMIAGANLVPAYLYDYLGV